MIRFDGLLVKFFFEALDAVFDTAIPDIATNLDTDSAEKLGAHRILRRDLVAILFLQVRLDLLFRFRIELDRTFDLRAVPLDLELHKPPVVADDLKVATRLCLRQFAHDALHDLRIKHPIDDGSLKQLLRGALEFFA